MIRKRYMEKSLKIQKTELTNFTSKAVEPDFS
jgi:hypothetical protein